MAGLTGVVGLAALGGLTTLGQQDDAQRPHSPAAMVAQTVDDDGIGWSGTVDAPEVPDDLVMGAGAGAAAPAGGAAVRSKATRKGTAATSVDPQARVQQARAVKKRLAARKGQASVLGSATDQGHPGPGGGPPGGGDKVIPVPCVPDALIAAVTRANAEGAATLRLAPHCTYTLTVNSGGNGLPPITGEITIKGEDSTITRAANATAFRFFQVDSGGRLRLEAVTLTGGQSPDSGGAVWVQPGGALKTEKTRLLSNVTEDSGGAIYNQGVTTLEHTTAAGNSAEVLGGVVENDLGVLRVSESRLVHNRAGSWGGAVDDYSAGTVQFERTIIARNLATLGGGISGGSVTLGGQISLTESRVTDNVSEFGGGIYVEQPGEQLTLNRVTVAGNNASADGGGVWLRTSGNFEKVQIVGNTATGDGGGIWNGGTLALRAVKIARNQATNGGGIYNTGTLSLTSSRVVENTATATGGGIYTTTTTVTVDPDSVITANRPNNCVGTVPNCFG